LFGPLWWRVFTARLIQRTRESPAASTTAAESSVQASPITSSSKSVKVCRSTLPIEYGRTLLQLKVGMMTVTLGTRGSCHAVGARATRTVARVQDAGMPDWSYRTILRPVMFALGAERRSGRQPPRPRAGSIIPRLCRGGALRRRLQRAAPSRSRARRLARVERGARAQPLVALRSRDSVTSGDHAVSKRQEWEVTSQNQKLKSSSQKLQINDRRRRSETLKWQSRI
jgi:hypothetical protein